MDDDVAVQRVYLTLNTTVRVLRVLLFVPGVVILKGVSLVVRVQAVLLDQGLGDRGERRGRRSDMHLLCNQGVSSSSKFLRHNKFQFSLQNQEVIENPPYKLYL